MPKDRHPGIREEEEIKFDHISAITAEDGCFGYVTGVGFVYREEGVQRAVTSDINHQTVRHLIHFIDSGPAEGFASGAYREITGTAFPTNITWWESSSKLKKIVELNVAWSGVVPITEEWKVYDVDGSSVLATVSDSISYSGPFETSRTRTITVS